MAYLITFFQFVQICLIISVLHINQLTITNHEKAQDQKLVAAEDYVKELLNNKIVTTMKMAKHNTR